MIVVFFFGGSMLPAQTALDSLNTYLHPTGGRILTGSIYQNQYEQTWSGKASVYVFDTRHIGLLTDREYVEVNHDTIWTYQFENQQELIDIYSWEQFNLFSLLSGDFSQVHTNAAVRNEGAINIAFSIADMGVTGYLELSKTSYKPDHLRVEYDPDNFVDIKLASEQAPANEPDLPADISWEVIDLRE